MVLRAPVARQQIAWKVSRSLDLCRGEVEKRCSHCSSPYQNSLAHPVSLTLDSAYFLYVKHFGLVHTKSMVDGTPVLWRSFVRKKYEKIGERASCDRSKRMQVDYTWVDDQTDKPIWIHYSASSRRKAKLEKKIY